MSARQVRRGRRTRAVVPVLVAVLLASLFGVAEAAQTPAGEEDWPQVAVIGPMEPLADTGFAVAVNADGVVVGTTRIAGVVRPFRYDPDTGTLSDVGPAPATTAYRATGVNDAGTVVGRADQPFEGDEHSFAYDPLTEQFARFDFFEADDVNNSGVMVGADLEVVMDPVPHLRPIPAGIDLADPTEVVRFSTGTGRSTAVSNAGAAVGTVGTETGPWGLHHTRAFLRAGGLGGTTSTLSPPSTSNVWAEAFAVSEDEWVVGSLGGSDLSARRATAWPPGTPSSGTEGVDLGTLGGAHSAAYGINSHGLVVGRSADAQGRLRAFVHDLASGTMTDLGTLGGDSAFAADINDDGVVVGWSTDSAGVQRPFRVQVSMVPAPALAGQVVDDTGEPVQGATVSAYTEHDVWVGSATTATDEDGSFALAVLAPGDHRIMVQPPAGAALSRQWLGGNQRRSATVLEVDLGTDITGLEVVLPGAGALTGTVTAPGGAPVPGTAVWVYASTDAWVGTVATRTSGDGTFRLGTVPPGDYRVVAVPPAGSGLRNTWHAGQSLRSAGHVHQIEVGTELDLSIELLVED